MSLLAPWFLAGLGLLAAPVIAHLIRRATRDRVAFSAVRFLTASAPRLDRRSRIQHPLLLALRLLILAVLALAFARPYFPNASPLAPNIASPRHVIVLLDRSASMQRTGLWEAAQTRVETIATDLNDGDDFSLLLADDHAQPLLPATLWRETAPDDRPGLLRSLLADATPGFSTFHLDDAVHAAIEAHQELSTGDAAVPSAPVVHVVSDLAAGTRISGLASLAWPPGLVLHLDAVSAEPASNVALRWLGWTTATDDAPAQARVRLLASPDTPTTSIQLRLYDPVTDSDFGATVTQVVSRQGVATVLIPLPPEAPDAFAITLSGDYTEFDNTLWVVRPAPRQLPVVLLNATSPADSASPAYYLTRAIAGWRDPQPVLRSDLAAASDALPPLIIAPVAPDAASLNAVRSRVEAGATALLLVNTPTAAARVADLLGDAPWQFSAAPPPNAADFALFGQIDFTHPLFAPFADPRFSDFSRIRFWSQPHLVPPADSAAQVVARFEVDTAAVLEAPLGRGIVVVWAGGWTPEQSQWVLSSKFVPWLQNLAERTAGGPLRASVTGLDQLDRLGPYTDLQPVKAAASPRTPGVYQLSRDNFPARPVALNVPERESELTPLDSDVFAQLGAPLAQSADAVPTAHEEAQRREESAALTESRQKLWRWLLLAAAVLLVGESLLSLRLARRAPALT